MDDSSSVAVSSASPEAAVASPSTKPPAKKKRNLPGMPDPDAEVIALSPKTLLATNRFVCEICTKGFQRDQNLQLHRRGHNLPWKLKQRTGGKDQVRKRVYVCPEPNCVHHNPDRALGDLTGIKKHFCRKHGEKKWKCERCSKKYAVQSDWKAHMKTCGTEYKCDCGTVFSRRDSFITHRAFCDALAEESSRTQALAQPAAGNPSQAKPASSPPQPPPPLTPTTTVVSPVLSIQSSDLPENATELLPPSPAVAAHTTALAAAAGATTSNESGGGFGGVYPAPTQLLAPPLLSQSSPSSLSNMVCPAVPSDQGGSLPSPSTTEPTSLSLFLSSTASSIFSRPEPNSNPRLYAPSGQPAMSATALLQKAAQMGAAASNTSLLRDLGLAMPLTSYGNDNAAAASTSTAGHWGGHPKAENTDPTGHMLGLGLTSQESSGIPGLMMGPSSMFSTKPMTLDFLGLGMGLGGAANGGLSAFLTSLEGNFTAAPPTSSGGGRQSSG